MRPVATPGDLVEDFCPSCGSVAAVLRIETVELSEIKSGAKGQVRGCLVACCPKCENHLSVHAESRDLIKKALQR